MKTSSYIISSVRCNYLVTGITPCWCMYGLHFQELKFPMQKKLSGLCQVVELQVQKRNLPARVFQVSLEKIERRSNKICRSFNLCFEERRRWAFGSLVVLRNLDVILK